MEGTKRQRWLGPLFIWALVGAGLGAVAGVSFPLFVILTESVPAGDQPGILIFTALVGLVIGGICALAGGLFGLLLTRFMSPDRLGLGVKVFGIIGVLVGALAAFLITLFMTVLALA